MNLEKLVQRCPYLQSQMHSDDDSAESIVDSDLEDGELRKMLDSPLYRQDREDCRSSRIPTAPGKPAAMIQERGASAMRTQAGSSQEPRATVKPAAMFSSGRKQTKVLFSKSADPSNLGRSLLEGNKIICSSQARSELMKTRTSSWISKRSYQ